MQDKSALGRAVAMVRDLRARCPWDRVQTRESLRPYLVEEVLELDHALGEGEPGPIRAELSDLLLHLAFQLVIAEERNEFTADQVADRSGSQDAPPPSRISSTSARPSRGSGSSGGSAVAGRWRGSSPRCPRCSWPTGSRSARPPSDSTGRTSRGRLAKVREELDEIEGELAGARLGRAAGRRDRRSSVRRRQPRAEGRCGAERRARRGQPEVSRPVRAGRGAGRRARDRRGDRGAGGAGRAVGRGEGHDANASALRVQPVDLAGERDRLADVRDAADPRHGPLDAQPESGMDERAVLPEIEVPAIRLRVEPLLVDSARAACRSRPPAATRR